MKVATTATAELENLRSSFPATVAELDAVLPAIIVSVSMLIGVSLFTMAPTCDSDHPESQIEDNHHA